ncbi:MAG TPA: Rieske (2Fe-2S) protein [Anaerolineae bacterium]|nr:Rieske (2Fe-2S) protein [Anaerolineae bacterium]
MSLVRVAEVGDIAPGEMTSVKVSGQLTLLANVGGAYYAIHGICTHLGCTLSNGRLNGNIVTCPCHGSRFDVTTGEVVHGPAQKPELSYSVTVEDNDILIEEQS